MSEIETDIKISDLFEYKDPLLDQLKKHLDTFTDPTDLLDDREKRVQDLAKKVVVQLKADSPTTCGSKHGNLIKMGTVINQLALSDLHIPMPQGISSDDIHAFWKTKNVAVLTHWEELKTLYANHKSATPFLDTPQASWQLQKIEQAIGNVFKDTNNVPLPETWIKEHENEFLMVRSSGAEDSKETANAGGNLSKAYVPCEREAVCQAVSEVIQSYFSKTSLQNRINAGLNPFEEEIKLGVVLQELIGEPVGGATQNSDIPVSFVLFTNEPLFIGTEQFRVMQLSATYGHGEAVVGSQGIATDTALILHSVVNPHELYIVYTNEKKIERLAPISTNPTVLGKMANPELFIDKPALSLEQVANIYRDAILVEGIFDAAPTDIEGVLKNGVVHFVQARPVNRKPSLPSYLSAHDGVISSLQAETVVSAHASVVQINKKEEILCASTLEEAEQKYNAGAPPKLIVVKTKPSATSHPVVNFRGLNIPCLYLPNDKELTQMLAKLSNTQSLAVCMQTATIHLWDTDKVKLSDRIVSGFAVHPANITVSLPVIDDCCISSKPKDSLELKNLINNHEWTKIEEKIKAFSHKLRAIETSVGENPHACIATRLTILQNLETYLTKSLAETKACIETEKTLRLQSLFYIKTLETLLIGSQTPHRVIGQYSLLDADEIFADVEKFLEYQKEISFAPHLISLLPFGAFAHEEWKTFLINLERRINNNSLTQPQVEKFQRLVNVLHQTGTFPAWLTFFQKNRSLEEILQEMDGQNMPVLLDLLNEQTKIDRTESTIGRFADPASFKPAWQELQANLALWNSSNFLNKIQNASPLIQMIGYQTVTNAVNLLDIAIKEMKASQNFSTEDKVKLFKDMLAEDFNLMKALTHLIPQYYTAGLIRGRTLSQYVSEIEQILNNFSRITTPSTTVSWWQKPTRPSLDSLLLPSKNFSVSAAMIGSRAEFSRHQPETLEDILTLLHQNSLASINLVGQNIIRENIRNSLLPTTFKNAMTKVENGAWGKSVQRLAIDVTDLGITAKYNVPLRNHSGHLELHYDHLSQEITMTGQFLGEARTRWNEISLWAQALHDAGLIIQKKPYYKTDQELTFDWTITTPILLEQALEEYNEMAEWTFQAGGGFSSVIESLGFRWARRGKGQDLIAAFAAADRSIRNACLKGARQGGVPAGKNWWWPF